MKDTSSTHAAHLKIDSFHNIPPENLLQTLVRFSGLCYTILSKIEGGVIRAGSEANVYRHRPEILLRLRGVPGAGPRSYDHQPSGGGSQPHGEDHLPRRLPLAESLRHPWPGPPLRGGPAGQGGQRPAAAPRPRREAGGQKRRRR